MSDSIFTQGLIVIGSIGLGGLFLFFVIFSICSYFGLNVDADQKKEESDDTGFRSSVDFNGNLIFGDKNITDTVNTLERVDFVTKEW